MHRDIVVIGTSAGGVDALIKVVRKLPKNLAASVFVTMHVGSGSRLPEILAGCETLPAVHARNNARYRRGCIYVAPSQHHLLIKDGVTLLSRGPRVNGHRPAIDVLFRSAAREHRDRVVGVILSGGLDDGSAGLYTIKARGGVAIVQDPSEAVAPAMPKNALEFVDVDYCLPVGQIGRILVQLADGKATTTADSPDAGSSIMEDRASADEPTTVPPGDQIPVSCPECNGPLFAAKEGRLVRYQCFVGHAFSPESLGEEHSDALERALWIAIRKLKERVVLHHRLLTRRRRRKGEEKLRQKLEESVATGERDLKLLRDILDRI